MRILVVLTYYLPYVSGVSVYTERLVNSLGKRGHQLTVLTSRYDAASPLDETVDGLRIVRAPVWLRLGKGLLMPAFGRLAAELIKEHEIVNLHLPQFDAFNVACLAGACGRPVILTYHSELKLPAGIFNFLANRAIDLVNRLAGARADRVVAYTSDFASHSRFLRQFAQKTVVIAPPVAVAATDASGIDRFIREFGLGGAGPYIGMAARLAAEKGIEILLEALPLVQRYFPRVRVLFAGQYRGVPGEEAYARYLQPRLDRYRHCWEFLGLLDQEPLAAFYHCLDVLVVPSLNSTETFGLVQVEAMLCGTPVVASDLPGVRQAVLQTGLGEIVPPGDSRALAAALVRVLSAGGKKRFPGNALAELFSPESCALAYEKLFTEVLADNCP